MHEPIYEVRDPVHGFVKLTRAEWKIVDCPTFQRLRDIRQLAMGRMAYPGATHTRFEHSLGCVHVSSQMLDLLGERQGCDGRPTFAEAFATDDDAVSRGRKTLRLAALLHDLGHPPYSHTGEDFLPREQHEGESRRVSHEEMTARLIRESEVAGTIQENYSAHAISPEDVIAVATAPKWASGAEHQNAWNVFLNTILAGELGSDRIDYLLRDAHHSGQGTGVFDYQKLLNALALVPQLDGEGYELGMDEAGWLVAEQMVVARYLMYVSLYFHKTVRIYERHLQRFLGSWLPEAVGEARWPADVEKYRRLTDVPIAASICEAGTDPNHRWHELARPFLDRSHLRLAKELVLADNWRKGEGRRVPDRDRFDNLREYVSIKLGDRDIECDQPDRSAFGNADKILVLMDGKPRYIAELSEIVRGMPARIWRGRIYAPKDQKDSVRKVCDAYLTSHPPAEDTGNGQPDA